MEAYLYFSASIQCFLITLILAQKLSKNNLSSLLLTLLMACFTLMFSSWTYSLVFRKPIPDVFVPIWYALGPIFYLFIRFTFLPSKNVKSKYWLWFFLPFGLEMGISVFYFLTYFINRNFAQKINNFSIDFEQFSFYHFILFFTVSIFFLIKNKAFITMNIAYKQKLKWVKYLISILLILILFHLFSGIYEPLLSGILVCLVTMTSLVKLAGNTQIFSEDNFKNTELLKEALNEQKRGVIITNKYRIIEYANDMFLAVIGYRHRDVIGRKPSFLIGALTKIESVNTFKEKLSEGMEFEAEIIKYRKNGEAFKGHVQVIPIFHDGDLTHFVSYVIDKGTIAKAVPFEDDVRLLETIKIYFETKKPFKNKHLKAELIADFIEIPPRRLGEILKKYEEQSFIDFVNRYRTREVIHMLENDAMKHLTLEAIGFESGFNSKAAFFRAFKKETGKTPANFPLQSSSKF